MNGGRLNNYYGLEGNRMVDCANCHCRTFRAFEYRFKYNKDLKKYQEDHFMYGESLYFCGEECMTPFSEIHEIEKIKNGC